MSERETVMIEGAQLVFRNFSGAESQFNPAGSREFSVLLDDETAQELLAKEYNVKFLKPRDEEGGDTPQPYLPVAVSYKLRPPTIVMITSTGRAKLDEGSIETLDWADIINADLIITPSRWVVGAKTGIKAYLKSLYVTVQEDALERKYAVHQEMDHSND